MKPLMISPFDRHPLAKMIANALDYEFAPIILRDFPDGETYVQFQDTLQERDIIIFTSLDHPNQKILPLIFIAETAKASGAKRVGLCAPYLAYMRQDIQFKPGEGITSTYFATLLSQYFDWLVTVDPHLHRYHALSEIYSIPTTVLHAAPSIAQWISEKVESPFMIGPDRESEQWVKEIAEIAQIPYVILEKIRHGDRAVEVSHPDLTAFQYHTPVLVDDIISTGHTLMETIMYLKKINLMAPVCIGVHAIFVENAYQKLLSLGAKQVVTCNTIFHDSNGIDLSSVLKAGIQKQESI